MNEPDLTLVVFSLNEIEGLKAVGPRINTQKKFLKRILMIDYKILIGKLIIMIFHLILVHYHYLSGLQSLKSSKH